jgi:glycosyltransferase involved in cell wall biosynthesis
LAQIFLLAHNHYQRPGGEDRVFAAETALLRQHGHEVMEYVEDNRRIDGMSQFALATQAIWSRPTHDKLLRLLRDVNPSVVHFHNTFPLISPSAYSACRSAGIPVVQTLHNYRLLCPAATFFRSNHVCEDCLGKTPPWPGVVHACYRASRTQTAALTTMLTIHRGLRTWQDRVDGYIALTEFSRNMFVAGGLPPGRLFVKPNFVHPDPGMGNGEGRYALFVGRLSPEKGLRTLSEAWHYLDGIPLKIAGDGPLMRQVQERVKAAKLEQVALLGWRDRQEVLGLIKGARFLIFPSECYENSPATILEAFACGTSVIASRLGAMAEIVEDGRTGFHFQPGDPEDLAATVQRAWTDTRRAQVMKVEARAEYESRYTAERNYRMLTDIYAMAGRGRTS